MIETVEEFFGLSAISPGSYTDTFFSQKRICTGTETGKEAGTGTDITDAGTERNLFIKCKISSEFILAGISPMGGRRRILAVCQCTGIYQNIK